MSDTKKIMIVEDDIFVSDIYQVKVGTMEGYEAIVATNGQEALKKLEEGVVPDLIMLDIVMPYMDGIEFLKRIKAKEEWKNIPVLMLSNLYDKDQVDDAIAIGANDYLIKSHFTPSEVMEKAVSLLHG